MITPLELDLAADEAWPAETGEALGPWKLRYAQGVTRRANSALTVAAGDTPDLARAVEAAERFYADRHLPATFYISPASLPEALDGFLERRDYFVSGASEVWARTPQAPTAPFTPGAEMEERPSREWLDCVFDEAPTIRRVHESIVCRTPAPRRFASIVLDGRVASAGMAVATRGMGGIFCMHTRPSHRRQGLARQVLAALVGWLSARSPAAIYLQVMKNNLPAMNLYRLAGFARRYDYHYRIATQRFI